MDDLSGTRLEEFEIERELGAGGFGVTYLARDRSLGRRVAVKEYLPLDRGARRPDGGAGPRSAAQAEDYRWGLDRFLEEAQALARVRHPHVVQVHRMIEARGTAYMAMEYVEGRSLAAALRAEGPWPEKRVLALLDALTAGLAAVHAAGLLHRDVKPANVMLREDGSPVLIDFGSARQAVGSRSRSLTMVLTPGYAPFEQYSTKGRQGPWTDLYALGAVAYEALSGRVPEEAPARMEDDTLPPVAAVAAHPVSAGLSAAIGSALAVRWKDRPRSLAAWWAEAGAARNGGDAEPARPPAPPRPVVVPAAPELSKADKSGASGQGSVDGFHGPRVGVLEGRRSGASGQSVLALVLFTAFVFATIIWAFAGRDPLPADVAVPEGARPGGRRADVQLQTPQAVEEALDLNRLGWLRIQEGLAVLGFVPGVPDGLVGPRTRRAIRAYQESAGKPATGFLDAPDLPTLQSAARRLPAPPRAGAVFRDDCHMCPEMVVIPGGTFRMGSPASEVGRLGSEGPQHRVTLRSFALGVTEVTFDEWEACVLVGGCGGYRPSDEGWGRGARPVINVSWEDARAYVRRLSQATGESYRLPSEAEWEHAARGGTTTSRYWGDSLSSQCEYANGADAAMQRGFSTFLGGVACDDGAVRTTPVGSYSPNAFGLFDMLGNVREWTEDCWHENYRGAPADGSPWLGDCDHRRVLRGCAWSCNPRALRSAARLRFASGSRMGGNGFRVARTLD